LAGAALAEVAHPAAPSAEYSIRVPLKASVPKFHLLVLAAAAASALVRLAAVPSSSLAEESKV